MAPRQYGLRQRSVPPCHLPDERSPSVLPGPSDARVTLLARVVECHSEIRPSG